MEEQIRFPDHAPGSALHQDPLEAAILFVAAERGQMVDVEVDVARNEEIHEAVAIVVGPGGSGAEAASADAGLLGHIFELAIAQVAIERIPAEAGDVNVRQAVVVEVGDGHAHAPAFASQSGAVGDVGEFEIRVLMVKRDHGIAALAVAIDRRAVHRDDVELAIVVAVDETDATAHGFDDVFLFRSGNVGNGQAGFFGHIFELRYGGLR